MPPWATVGGYVGFGLLAVGVLYVAFAPPPPTAEVSAEPPDGSMFEPREAAPGTEPSGSDAAPREVGAAAPPRNPEPDVPAAAPDPPAADPPAADAPAADPPAADPPAATPGGGQTSRAAVWFGVADPAETVVLPEVAGQAERALPAGPVVVAVDAALAMVDGDWSAVPLPDGVDPPPSAGLEGSAPMIVGVGVLTVAEDLLTVQVEIADGLGTVARQHSTAVYDGRRWVYRP